MRAALSRRAFARRVYLSHLTSSHGRLGRHETGLAIQRLMSDSCHPVPLVLILSWAGNVPSAILR